MIAADTSISAHNDMKENLRNSSGDIHGRYGGRYLPPGEYHSFDDMINGVPDESYNLHGTFMRNVYPEYYRKTGNELVDSLQKYYPVAGLSATSINANVAERAINSAAANMQRRTE